MMQERGFPDGRLLAYYGDDFTGSAAVMEILTYAGLPTVLFVGIPGCRDLAKFSGFRGVGIAGVSRSRSPKWMDAHLPAIFEVLGELGAPITHYKISSTFESAPEMGSIGHAIDLAIPILGGDWHPVIVAAPEHGRYQVFGNLFATSEGVCYRLDRHPTMSRHPVTPMGEADLRRHLSRQTSRPIGLVDIWSIGAGEADGALARARASGHELVLFDVLDQASLEEAGRIVWTNRGGRLLAIGSQGLELALIAYWRKANVLGHAATLPSAAPVDRIVCVSGSCSPLTASQIAYAADNGFAAMRLDVLAAVDESRWEVEVERAGRAALAALEAGHDALIFTALGPSDPAIPALRDAIEGRGLDASGVRDRIGRGLGRLLGQVLRESGLTRAVVAGGDTSGQVVLSLGISALTALAPLAPGVPLCRAYRPDSKSGDLEIALKGGQGGMPDFFCVAKHGGSMPQLQT